MFNQGQAWADSFFWAPLQIAGSVGMVLGQRWGFLLALGASGYWWFVWGMWPIFGVLEGIYCFVRLMD